MKRRKIEREPLVRLSPFLDLLPSAG